MGCDIHLYVEKLVNGKWESMDQWEKDDEFHDICKEDLVNVEDTLKKNISQSRRAKLLKQKESLLQLINTTTYVIPYEKRFYSGRNYDLFTILAGVRHSGLNTISSPRGLPGNMSPLVRKEYRKWLGDGHSHSYFTIEELDRFDWDQKCFQKTIVDASSYYQWYLGEYKGPPMSMYRFKESEEVTVQEMKNRINKALEDFDEEATQEMLNDAVNSLNISCSVCWEETYAETCPRFTEETMPKLRALGLPNEVRIIFWFDN